MSGYAMFSLKSPSLLQFDEQFRDDRIAHNLRHLYHIDVVPSDTQMRSRLDDVNLRHLRQTFSHLLHHCQRSKRPKYFEYYDGRYLQGQII